MFNWWLLVILLMKFSNRNTSTVSNGTVFWQMLVSIYQHLAQSYLKPDNVLPIFLSLRDYNWYMEESDRKAQTRQYYIFNTRPFWYCWSIFRLFIYASVVNTYTLWKIAQPQSNLTHQQFQQEITMYTTKPGRKWAETGPPSSGYGQTYWLSIIGYTCLKAVLACLVDKIRV